MKKNSTITLTWKPPIKVFRCFFMIFRYRWLREEQGFESAWWILHERFNLTVMRDISIGNRNRRDKSNHFWTMNMCIYIQNSTTEQTKSFNKRNAQTWQVCRLQKLHVAPILQQIYFFSIQKFRPFSEDDTTIFDTKKGRCIYNARATLNDNGTTTKFSFFTPQQPWAK